MGGNRGITVSNIAVGSLMGAALFVVIYMLLPLPWAISATGLALFEAYTIVNHYPEDTLSESVWRLSARPLVPFLFGMATYWALQQTSNIYVGFALGFLDGHFFFQAQRHAKELD